MSSNDNNTAGYIGCGIIAVLGLIFLPYVTIPVGILALIGLCMNKKQKSQDEKDLEKIKALLKKGGHL